MNNNSTSIIVIEPSVKILKKIEKHLLHEGFHVYSKKNIQQALDFLKDNFVDLILANYILIHDMKDFVYRIKYKNNLKNSSIIIYGMDNKNYERYREVLKSGADDYIYLEDYGRFKYLVTDHVNENIELMIIQKMKHRVVSRKSNVTVEEIADELKISRQKLYDLCKRYEKVSPKEFIYKYRISLFKEAALNGVTFEVVCQEIGVTLKCMKMYIKRKYGMAAVDYWKELREE